MAEKVWFHVDVNSAFLSWSAAHRVLVLGEEQDLREIPSVVAPLHDVRRGIVLARSQPAKKLGIKTGEPLGMAKDKCPDLVVVPPDYDLYVTASRKFVAVLQEFSPCVEQATPYTLLKASFRGDICSASTMQAATKSDTSRKKF